MNLRAVLLLCAAVWLPTAFAQEDPAPALRLTHPSPMIAGSPADTTVDSGTDISLPGIVLSEPPAVGMIIDLTAEQTDLWARVRLGFSMPDLDNELVRRQQVWYMNRPEYLRRVIERSRRYMHYILEEIEKRGMPTELALLPMVESAYNPMALSSARASGLWQFIPSTGKNYKLDQNWWVDERRDIVASTGAALDYLKYIYELHGDWQLALASYNWGEGAVGRAIARNRSNGLPTDYSSLRMPKETQNYVPKLQALKNIISNPSLWAMLNIPTIPNKPYFSTIQKPADMDIKIAAKLAEMPLQEFMALNPAHNRPLIKADIPLLLPADKVDTFRLNLEEHDDPLSSWQSYTFQPKDRIDRVAARFGIGVAELRSINGLGGRSTRVRAGQMLLVPARNGTASIDIADFATPVGESDPPMVANKGRAAKVATGLNRHKVSARGQATRTGKRGHAGAWSGKSTGKRAAKRSTARAPAVQRAKVPGVKKASKHYKSTTSR